MGSLLIVVSTPSLAFSLRIVEAHEPMRIQTFAAELTVEGLNEGVVGWFAGPREVERDITLISPEVLITRPELAALGDPYGCRGSGSSADLSSTSTTSAPRKLNRTSVAGENRKNVSMMVQHPQFPAGRQLVHNRRRLGLSLAHGSDSAADQSASVFHNKTLFWPCVVHFHIQL